MLPQLKLFRVGVNCLFVCSNFLVDSLTGEITAKHEIEQTPRPYVFPAVATDGGGAYTVVNVTMTVQCETGSGPSFSPPAPPPLELQPVVQFLHEFYEFPIECGIASAEVGQVSVRAPVYIFYLLYVHSKTLRTTIGTINILHKGKIGLFKVPTPP